MTIHPRVETTIEQDAGILETYDLTVLSAEDGRCTMRARVPDNFINAAGFAHGSIAFSIMDTACAYAVASREARGVTTSANVIYVKAARAGEELHGSVEILSMGKRVATLRGETRAKDDSLIAHGSFTFQLIPLDAT